MKPRSVDTKLGVRLYRIDNPVDMWGRIAEALHVSREFVKRTTYLMMYDGDVDPWVAHLIREELYRWG